MFDVIFYKLLFKDKKFFKDGVGDLNFINNLETNLKPNTAIKTIKTKLLSKSTKLFSDLYEYEAVSPNKNYLPPKSQKLRFLVVEPQNKKIKASCIHFAATGEMGYQSRLYLSALPLSRQGIRSIILENPFYGTRRPKDQPGFFLKSFSDFWKMCWASIEEGKSLVQWSENKFKNPVIVAGISMGASMASMVASELQKKIGLVSFLGAFGPEVVFTKAVLSKSVDWHALASDLNKNLKETKVWLAEKLKLADLDRFKPPPYRDLIIQIGAKGDYFVPFDSVKKLNLYWSGSKLEKTFLGHVGTTLLKSNLYRDSIKKLSDDLSS